MKVDCPLREDADAAVAAAGDFERSLRRLRLGRYACRTCVRAGQCPLLAAWNALIVQAITEINLEWGMLGARD